MVDNMVVPPTTIDCLPNEILVSILSHFPTPALPPLTPTSHRLYALIISILHTRTLEASQLNQHSLLLKCFHPSTKATTLYCRPLPSSQNSEPQNLHQLRNIYTSFLPLKQLGVERPPFRSGLADGSGWFAPSTSTNTISAGDEEDLVYQDITLESHELFSQLCTVTKLVKTTTKRGLFASCVNIGEGLLRVWRDWLAEAAEGGDTEVLWADSGKNVGLKLRVVELEMSVVPGPPLRMGEERDVSYRVFYEELVVKSTQLLLMIERSREQELKHEGKAVMFGAWSL